MIVDVWRHARADRLDYIERPKPECAEISERIGSNIIPRGVAAHAQRCDRIAARRPEVRRPFLHIFINPRRSSFDSRTWHRLVRRALQLLGLSTSRHLYVAALHRRTDAEHCHIFVCRIGVDGTVWAGQHERWRAIDVARQLATEFQSSEARFEPCQPADHYKLVRVNRLLVAQGSSPISTAWLIDQLTEVLKERVGTVDEFIRNAAYRGITLERRTHVGGTAGLCLVAPTVSGHRLNLSDATRGLFSWLTLHDFYAERRGRLVEIHDRITEGDEVPIDPESEPETDPNPDTDPGTDPEPDADDWEHEEELGRPRG